MSRAGTILRVNLTSGNIDKEPTSKYTKNWIGGGALGAKLIWDNVSPAVKALDPENMLTFNAGPLSGTLLGTKMEVVSKSPKYTNNPMGTAGMGGQFPAEMKFAGYDSIAITGKAESPVYLYVSNDDVEIRDASHLWGLNTGETQERLRVELNDPDVQIACIGPAGENQVVYALIIHDIQNAASWGGFGAVMGSKNLKAVAVRGTKALKVADPKRVKEKWDKYFQTLFFGNASPMVKSVNREGTGYHYDDYIRYGLWQWGWGLDASWDAPPLPQKDTLSEFTKKYSPGNLGCAFCPVQCQRNFSVPGIGNGGATCNLMFTFRAHLKTYDTKTWFRAMKRINDYGIEGQELSMITGWLMLLYEKGLIRAEDTNGVPMEWGSDEAIMTVIDSIALQKGFGKIFRTGIAKPAGDLAHGDGKQYVPYERNEIIYYFLPEVGVLPLGSGGMRMMSTRNHFLYWQPPEDRHAMVDIYAREMGISREDVIALMEKMLSEYCEKWNGHKDGWKMSAVEGKAEYMWAVENAIASADITGHCCWLSGRFPHAGMTWNYVDAAEEVRAATGDDIKPEIMYDTIQRKRLTEVVYNILCEVMIGDFPEITDAYLKFLSASRKGGMFDGSEWNQEGCEIAGAEYCKLRGCDPETGIPTKAELKRLGLGDVIEKMKEAGLLGEER